MAKLLILILLILGCNVHAGDLLKVNAGVEYDFQGGYDDRVINIDIERLYNYDSNFTYGYSVGYLRMSDFTTPKDKFGKRYVLKGFTTGYACGRAGVSVRPLSFIYTELIAGPCYFQKAETLISGNVQFNTQMGIGFRDPKTKSTIGIHIRHFSNAGLKKPNVGINLYMITMGIALD